MTVVSEDPLLARLDRIEARLDRLVAVLDDALPTIGMVTDAADEAAARLQANGIDVDARAAHAAELVEKVSRPDTLRRLGGLLDRLDTLEPALALVENLDHTLAMAADAFDSWAGDQVAKGIDLDGRSQRVLHILVGLTSPPSLHALDQLVAALPKLMPVVELATTFEDTAGMLFDMFDAQVKEMQHQGIDPEARFSQVLDLVTRLTEPAFHAHLQALLDAAPGLMAATRTGEVFGRAVDEVASNAATPSLGMWGLLRALRDPEVQRAAGFAVEVARKVGDRLPEHMQASAATLPVRTSL